MYISVADPDLEIQEAPAARSSKRGMGRGGGGRFGNPCICHCLYLLSYLFLFLLQQVILLFATSYELVKGSFFTVELLGN